MTSSPTVIHVIDDDKPLRTAIGRLLRASGYQATLYESGEQFLENPPAPGRGCILLDIRMSGLSGFALQEQLKQLEIMLPIIFLTGHGDIGASVQAIKAGAEDFLLKPVVKETLLSTIDRALARARETCGERDLLRNLRSRVAAFTPRESEVFALVVHGKMNKQIAYELGMSERTVKAHRSKIMEKLQVSSVAEAVSIAERIGLVTHSWGDSG